MLDIETLSTSSNACILTIGAIKFLRNEEIPLLENCDIFYRRISKDTCDKVGLHTDLETIKWWNKQTIEAKDEIYTNEDRLPLMQVLTEFSNWFGNSKFIWSHGSVFDITILSNAYRACGMEPPWNFWNIRDTRTLFDIGKININNIPNNNSHHAIYDCHRQIIGVQSAFKKLKK